MSDKLAQAQTRRREAFARMETFRNEFVAGGEKFKDQAHRDAWKKINDDYNAASREIEELQAAADVHSRVRQIQEEDERRNHNPNPKTGRMPGQDDPDVRRGDRPAPPSEEDRCLAMQAWCRARMDLPLSKRHKEAAHRCRIAVNARRLDLPLPGHQRVRRLQKIFRTVHAELAEERALSAVSGTAGAVTIPEGFVAALEINMLAYGVLLQEAEIIRTETGNEMPWPTADDTTNEGEIIGENTAQNTADPSFAAVLWRAYKFSSKFVLVPVELLDDSAFDMVSELGRMLGERIARALNRKCTTGTGANMPKGIELAATLGITAASATAIADIEVVRLIHSLDPAYRTPEAIFMGHDNTFLAVRLLKDSQGRFIWRAGLELGQPDRLLGYRTAVNQHCASSIATTNKTLFYGQFRKYKIRQVRQLRLRHLVERFADTDQEGFLGLLRADGNLLDAGTSPIKYLQQQ